MMRMSLRVTLLLLAVCSTAWGAIATDDTITVLPFTVTDAMSGTSGDHYTIGVGDGSIFHSDDQAIIFSVSTLVEYIDFLFESDDTLYWGEGGDKNENGLDIRASGLDQIHDITSI